MLHFQRSQFRRHESSIGEAVSDVFTLFFYSILGVVRKGSPWTGPQAVRGPGPWWGSADRGSVFSGYPTKRHFCSHCNDFVSRGTRSRHLNEITTSEASCETDASDLEDEQQAFGTPIDDAADGQFQNGDFAVRHNDGRML